MARVQTETSLRIHLEDAVLDGDLAIPSGAAGLVIFAHGSGSSRHSPRNTFVARQLQDGGLATLLLDLLTGREDEEDELTRQWRFDIPLLANRLVGVARWAGQHQATRALVPGFFGASTGAGAALVAASRLPEEIGAVVSRGGRPDLAGWDLDRVRAPTLLIVGGYDELVLRLNREAFDRLREPRELAVVPRATHLFDEPGALEEVARLARDWFVRWLR